MDPGVTVRSCACAEVPLDDERGSGMPAAAAEAARRHASEPAAPRRLAAAGARPQVLPALAAPAPATSTPASCLTCVLRRQTPRPAVLLGRTAPVCTALRLGRPTRLDPQPVRLLLQSPRRHLRGMPTAACHTPAPPPSLHLPPNARRGPPSCLLLLPLHGTLRGTPQHARTHAHRTLHTYAPEKRPRASAHALRRTCAASGMIMVRSPRAMSIAPARRKAVQTRGRHVNVAWTHRQRNARPTSRARRQRMNTTGMNGQQFHIMISKEP